MRIIHDFAPGSVARSAIAIGNFDGVHRGHQAVVDRLVAAAGAHDAEPVVVTFEPLPREFLLGAAAPPRLTGLRGRLEVLANLGVGTVLVARFDRAFAELTPEAFVERVLVAALGAKSVVVGGDFRFGHQRAGDFDRLVRLGDRHAFEVIEAPTVSDSAGRISSTRVRAALGAGDLEAAAELLGRPYTVTGRVRYGDALGRELGFPTANLVPERPLAIADGVYAVRVRREDGTTHAGAAHWGRKRRLEVHLLDYEGDLYGERLVVEFGRFLRPDREFADLDRLKGQMVKDVEEVRELG